MYSILEGSEIVSKFTRTAPYATVGTGVIQLAYYTILTDYSQSAQLPFCPVNIYTAVKLRCTVTKITCTDSMKAMTLLVDRTS